LAESELIRSQDEIRQQKEEIKALKESLKAMSCQDLSGSTTMNRGLVKLDEQEKEKLENEVMVANERKKNASSVYCVVLGRLHYCHWDGTWCLQWGSSVLLLFEFFFFFFFVVCKLLSCLK